MARGCFINNKWVETADRLSVLSPWSGETLDEVSLAGEGSGKLPLPRRKRRPALLKNFLQPGAPAAAEKAGGRG